MTGSGAPTDLPVVQPGDLGPPGREGCVHAVVLAAGTSARFGSENKLLARVDGEPVVRRAVGSLVRADDGHDEGAGAHLDGITVVLGHEADRVREALSGLDVDLVENPAYESGQASSVHVGVGVARERDADAVLFALGDMPRVDPSSVAALVRAYRAGGGDALAAAYEGRRGNPVLFDARYFDRLEAVGGDEGGRSIFVEGDRSALVETGDPGVVADVDTPGDLDEVREG